MKWTRDWLRDLQLLIGASMVVFAGIIVFRLVSVFAGGAVCAGIVGAPVDVAVTGLRPGAQAADTAAVCVESPSVSQVMLMLLHDGPALVAAGIAAALLYRIVRDARRHDPFTATTVRRLRQLAWFLLVAGVVVTSAANTSSGLLLHTMVERGTAPNQAMWTWLFVAVGVGAVAEIVNRGVALRAELDTVI
ncbi:DUF2975 domain-containing protein [Asanoa sp. WMMD1127]|uniref:DUF2975 domain-containing protein n=1 Tax=Asanoa sp. WMMD1127 TaxID=3016107 RepID=UPI0024176279|nr:DUF2975 domain-containing protein [Asanoa sp. WMMD1127]MDG4827263.1 DUF2975 domain-containing protein [Asanoa sp. WMMD1127]